MEGLIPCVHYIILQYSSHILTYIPYIESYYLSLYIYIKGKGVVVFRFFFIYLHTFACILVKFGLIVHELCRVVLTAVNVHDVQYRPTYLPITCSVRKAIET
jgi:hypothetical protein